MILFDAHIHLTDKEYSSHLQLILNTFRALKINACSVTVDIESSLRSLDLFKNNFSRDVVTQFIGIHPEHALHEDTTKFTEIFYANIGVIDGIGEIGLDPSYIKDNSSSYEIQKKVFNNMLSLAEKSKKPISVHSRRSLDEILEIIKTYDLGNVLLHWFAGSKKQLKKSMDMGLYVSYGPVLVYSEDKKVLLKSTNMDRFLIETDGPVRYSRCFKNLPSMSSSFLVSVAKCAGDVFGINYYDIAEVIRENSESFLMRSL
jgi:TatD DNase family protein